MIAEDRFWARVDRTGECWLWTGASIARGGHGRFVPDGRLRRLPSGWASTHLEVPEQLAHRFAWELTYGPIPAGLQVLHACDNPPCVRPEHLMLGTQRANMVDAGRKGRCGTGKNATHCKRGHAFEGNTYIGPQTGRRSCQACITIRGRLYRARLGA